MKINSNFCSDSAETQTNRLQTNKYDGTIDQELVNAAAVHRCRA